ncbi:MULTISPECIES: hypothetical protein [Streptomyces]|uniref:hypothetical protein n=1 Tax=Streptomyces TaxID=1883 RepID=UPI00073DE8F4|nr:hypothetical protein [Streptomyces sp. FBKL.4005]CUW33403.1 hypothetical protein TUE45_pSRTUE45a_0035 [Streptomyces reticuli]
MYGYHRTKGAPIVGALPGQDGPFGHRPAPDEDDDALLDIEEPDAMVPAPRDGSGR